MIMTLASSIVCFDAASIQPDINDQESAPTGADMAPKPGQYPRGAAWRTDESADPAKPGIMGGVWMALGGFFADLRAAAWQNHVQIFTSSVDVSIDDWEQELGLPDPCLPVQSGLAARRAAVQAKDNDQGGFTPAYFICLARSVGYEIDISEPRNFEFGHSAFGDDDELSNVILQDFWVIHVGGSTVRQFEFGLSQFGVDRLTDFNTALSIECLIERQAPIFTIPVFNYGT